jgi:hypothetical protein
MKIVTKLAFASLLALTALTGAAPAFAQDDAEALTAEERNVYTHPNGIGPVQSTKALRAHRGVDAFAHAPASELNFPNAYHSRDLGIGRES